MAGRSKSGCPFLLYGSSTPALYASILCIPDFHGNRSPLANPLIKGSFHNIAIHTTAAELFLSVIQGLALGTKLIIERIESEACIIIDELVLTGGLARSKVRNLFCIIKSFFNKAVPTSSRWRAWKTSHCRRYRKRCATWCRYASSNSEGNLWNIKSGSKWHVTDRNSCWTRFHSPRILFWKVRKI